MSKRAAEPREIPRFGQVWEWMGPPLLMAIGPTSDAKPPEPGVSRQWLFLDLDDGSLFDMWVGAQNETRPETWFVLDDD